jgi:hypothetical protein
MSHVAPYDNSSVLSANIGWAVVAVATIRLMHSGFWIAHRFEVDSERYGSTTSKSGLSGADFKLAGVGEVNCDRNVGQQKILYVSFSDCECQH